MLLDRLVVKRFDVGVADVLRLRLRRVERDALAVEVDDERAVVDLIRNGEGRVVVIRGSYVPDVLRDLQFAVDEVVRVARPGGRDELDLPFVSVGHFEDGEHLREVVLNTGDVHLVEDDDVDVVVIGRLVDALEDFGLVELLGEFVEVAEELGAVAPGRLDRGDRRVVEEIFAHYVRQRGLTCTGNTLQQYQLRGREARDHQPDGLDLIEEARVEAGEVADIVAELLEVHRAIVLRRHVVFVLLVDRGQTEEASAVHVRHAFLALAAFAGSGTRGGAAAGRRKSGGSGRGALGFDERADLVVGYSGRVELHREDALLLRRQLHDVAVQIGDLFKQVFVADERLAEAQVFAYAQDYQEHDRKEYAVSKKDRQYAQDPRKYVEFPFVARKLVEYHREIKQLEDSYEQL